MILLAPSHILDQEYSEVHALSFSSTVLKRVVNSTIKAETYQLSDVVEAGDLLRAAIADAHYLLEPKTWERQAS